MKLNKLLIISDTKMIKNDTGYYAFNSVVKELDIFITLFDSITWIGFDYSQEPLDNTLLNVDYPKINLILLRRSGGQSFAHKLKVLIKLIEYYGTIIKEVKVADVIHSRGPSVPMLLALLISYFNRKPKWWFKYANNWNDQNPPLSWGLQKRMMLNFKWVIGTVNGSWDNMPSHILPFENPCLENLSKIEIPLKAINSKWNFLFVGRMEEKKGFRKILEALKILNQDQIENVTFIGTGSEEHKISDLINNHPYSSKIKFLGSQSKEEVFEAMKSAHFLLLPSTSSEGFPKVIAEAWYNGCVPIVSDVSCIGQYIKDGVNGFVCSVDNDNNFVDTLKRTSTLDLDKYRNLQIEGYKMCSLFTYNYYKEKIVKEIISGL